MIEHRLDILVRHYICDSQAASLPESLNAHTLIPPLQNRGQLRLKTSFCQASGILAKFDPVCILGLGTLTVPLPEYDDRFSREIYWHKISH